MQFKISAMLNSCEMSIKQQYIIVHHILKLLDLVSIEDSENIPRTMFVYKHSSILKQ